MCVPAKYPWVLGAEDELRRIVFVNDESYPLEPGEDIAVGCAAVRFGQSHEHVARDECLNDKMLRA